MSITERFFYLEKEPCVIYLPEKPNGFSVMLLGDYNYFIENGTSLWTQHAGGHFRPEFLNRVDEIILFKPLTTNEIKGIVDKIVKELQGRLADRHITVELSDAAKEFVVEAGFDPMYGARPLKRYVQRQVETKLARELIAGTITDNSHVVVDVENNELVVHVK